jgi:tetratricopeptide (TPR) repeat protein
MKNIAARFGAAFVLALLLMPGVSVSGQSQYSSSPTDALSLWQARRAFVSASKDAILQNVSKIRIYNFEINSSSTVFTLDSIEFDATNVETTKKNGPKHFLIDLKDIKRVTKKCVVSNSIWCRLTTESGTEYMIQDKEAVRYHLYVCVYNAGENGCMHSADWFAAALNGLHSYAISHPNGLDDFHAQATAWRALTTKPALAENARILRLAAEDAIKRQKPDEALNDFELGVEADPTWAQGWFNAALLAGELGFFADASEHMQNYLELLPNATDAQSARDQIDLWKYKAGQSPSGVK